MENCRRLKEILAGLFSATESGGADPWREIWPLFIANLGNNESFDLPDNGEGGLDALKRFVLYAAALAGREIETQAREQESIKKSLSGLSLDSRDQLWPLFHPEAAAVIGREAEAEAELRKRRTVTLNRRAVNPIVDPGREILFTANVLLTVPSAEMSAGGLAAGSILSDKLQRVMAQPQEFWYDHPVPLGVKPENNEIIYGLRHLDLAMAFEKRQGTIAASTRLPVALSLSLTHSGLAGLARDYLGAELAGAGGLDHLDIFAFTENDCRDLLQEFLVPAARLAGFSAAECQPMFAVFGVDGEYGRHYSFLKAIAPLWQTVRDKNLRAVFKIDLDQVFPQEALLAETGRTALELLASPLWGAAGIDWQGREVFLGMIAGALVNEKDFGKGLFVPDVDYPGGTLSGADRVFCPRYPQAQSTRAEMMTRYGAPGHPDGNRDCLQRVHVTGGTNGILLEALFKWRPFTPAFIGRAEDQAYIMSTFAAEGPTLSYLHQSGLIMRHDKESFAADAIKAAASGKEIGDYMRILLFSAYAGCLPGGIERVKERLDPFSGSFISRLPVSLSVISWLARAESLFRSGETSKARQLLLMGAKRISSTIDFVRLPEKGASALENQLFLEKAAWNVYYDTLEFCRRGLTDNNGKVNDLAARAAGIIEACRLSGGGDCS